MFLENVKFLICLRLKTTYDSPDGSPIGVVFWELICNGYTKHSCLPSYCVVFVFVVLISFMIAYNYFVNGSEFSIYQ